LAERDDRAAFIALENDRVVGYITIYVEARPAYWKVKRVGHISGLMVRKEDRRIGIGNQLLDRARVYFSDLGVQCYSVYTAVENKAAIRFYEGQGMALLYGHLLGEITQARE
jgi:ribosomal protein S18 acetylase RimI-like enzyme